MVGPISTKPGDLTYVGDNEGGLCRYRTNRNIMRMMRMLYPEEEEGVIKRWPLYFIMYYTHIHINIVNLYS